MLSALVAFAHHAAAFTLVSALVAQHLAFTPTPDLALARRLQRLDQIYGASAGMVLAAGLLRVFVFEKGGDFYLSNPFFLAKLGLFIAAALLSIYPTIVFLSWRKLVRAGQAPRMPALQARRVVMLMRAQLGLFAAILFCAAFMAKGLP
jgi:putative membrane protein